MGTKVNVLKLRTDEAYLLEFLKAIVTGDITIDENGVMTIGLLTVSDAKIAAVAGSKVTAGTITKGEMGFKSVAITVSAEASSGASVADADLVGGAILGIYPTGNQDQLVDNVALGGNGAVTVTLAAAATADNTFVVTVLKP